MKSSTEISEAERQGLEGWREPKWAITTVGSARTLEASAREKKALVRARKVKDAEGLLRMILAYAVCDWSLRLVAAWALIQGIASLSDVALLYRLCQCGPWLGWLIGQLLQQRTAWLQCLAGVRVRLVDATVISRPGSKGTDWRVHLSFDLGRLCLDGMAVTDAQGGETLARFAPRADEIYVADRGYGVARSLVSLLCTGARLVVRINWHNLPLKNDLGRRLDLIQWIKGVTVTSERTVIVSSGGAAYALRLVAYPLPPALAERARERVVKQARKKGKPVSYPSWLAAGFVLLVTNLPAHSWEASRIIYLYRLRWQIELQIKRLKSLLNLDHLRAQDPRLVQTYLLAKLLAALLLDQLVQQTQDSAPELFQSLQRPVSLWRLHDLLLIGLRQSIVGYISLASILKALPRLRRYLCDPPRSRTQQLAWARRFLARLSAV